MINFLRIIAGLLLELLVGFIAAIIVGVIVMLLWNWLMTDLFNLPNINYWQGIGISLLCGLLFRNRTEFKLKD